MEEKNNDVKPEAVQSTPSVDKPATDATVSEDVKPQESLSKYQQQLANMRKAVEEEKEKLKKVRAERKATVTQPVEGIAQTSDIEQRWQYVDKTIDRVPELERKVLELSKIKEDPTFESRKDIVMGMMESNPGMTIDQADDAVLARLMRENLAADQQGRNFKQLNTSATPEPRTYKPTGDPVKDMLMNPALPPEAKEAIKRKLGIR